MTDAKLGMTERKAAAIIALAENYGKELSPELLKLWLGLLRSYSPEQVEAGAAYVMYTYAYKTMPPFAVLREAMDKTCGCGPEARELQALAEWNALWEAIRAYGSYAPPKLHPTTAFVVGVMGGWQAVCLWETRQAEWKRREFMELWAQADGKTSILTQGADQVRVALSRGGQCALGDGLRRNLSALEALEGRR